MIAEIYNAYKESRKEAEAHRQSMREVELQREYLKLQDEAAKVVADRKKLGVTPEEVKAVFGKPW